MVAGSMMAQTEVTIDFDNDYQMLFPDLPGVSSGTGDTYVDEGEFHEVTTSTAVQGVTVTLAAAEDAKTPNRIWATSPRLRLYSGTFTVSASNITKIVFNSNSNFNISTQNGTLNEKTWVGQADEVVFDVAKNTQLKSIVVTLGGEVIDPGNEPKVLYSEPFTSGLGKFTIDDVTLPEGLTYVWSSDSKYGAKASAYYNNTSYATESWLISPIIDLANATETSLEFTHALNKFSTIEIAQRQVAVLIKVGGGSWQTLDGVVYPETMSWDYVQNNIDISAYDGQKVQFAFKYTSDENSAGTWEIKPFEIKGKGEVTIETGDIPEAAQKIGSIAELRALGADATDIELTLTNAKVLFNDGNYIYLREDGSTICLYHFDSLKEQLKNNAVVNGTIRCDYKVYKMLPEVVTNNYTDLAPAPVITESDEAAYAIEVTLADIAAGTFVCDLVHVTATLVREITYKTDETGNIIYNQETGEPEVKTTNYFLQDGDTKIVVVNNGKNLKKLADAGVETIVATGIVNTANDAFQLKLTRNAVDPNAAVKGDVNGDKVVDVADISAILSHMAGNTLYDSADVNEDGFVDVADISNVLTIMAGI